MMFNSQYSDLKKTLLCNEVGGCASHPRNPPLPPPSPDSMALHNCLTIRQILAIQARKNAPVTEISYDNFSKSLNIMLKLNLEHHQYERKSEIKGPSIHDVRQDVGEETPNF